jgi:hypothetical protein
LGSIKFFFYGYERERNKRKRKKKKSAPSMNRQRHRFGGGGLVESGDKILQEFREPSAKFLFFESCIEKYKETYLRSYGVRGDGHCLFYAVIRCIVSALKYLSADTKATVTRVIGPDVIQKFKDGTYLGSPKDVELLRQLTHDIMRKLGDVSVCIDAALIGLEASKKGKSLDATDYADPDCSYLRAMSDALGIGIALEFPINPGSPERKWMFFQPGGDQMGLLMSSEYFKTRQNGTQTPEVTCKHVIYLKLESIPGKREHYTSYLFDGDFVPGQDEHEESMQMAVDRRLFTDMTEQQREEQRNALLAFQEEKRQREALKEMKKQVAADAEVAKKYAQEEEERRRRLDEQTAADAESARNYAQEEEEEERKQRKQEEEDAELARRIRDTAFGTTHPRRNKAFVSHVLRAASSHRLYRGRFAFGS